MHRDEVVVVGVGVAVEQLHGGIGQREEVALRGVEQVRQTAAVAVGGQRRDTDDAVTRGVDRDALITVLHATLFDIQPGRGDFLSEAQRLNRWLLEPDVGLALDPEWHVREGEVPGQKIGSVTADEVNEVTSYVSNIVAKHDLPEKLFVIHQFTQDMIKDKERVARPKGLAVTMNVDGFGDRPNKISKYDAFTSEATRFHDGFKLFYEEDTNLMSPGAVLQMRPPPDLVVYE